MADNRRFRDVSATVDSLTISFLPYSSNPQPAVSPLLSAGSYDTFESAVFGCKVFKVTISSPQGVNLLSVSEFANIPDVGCPPDAVSDAKVGSDSAAAAAGAGSSSSETAHVVGASGDVLAAVPYYEALATVPFPLSDAGVVPSSESRQATPIADGDPAPHSDAVAVVALADLDHDAMPTCADDCNGSLDGASAVPTVDRSAGVDPAPVITFEALAAASVPVPPPVQVIPAPPLPGINPFRASNILSNGYCFYSSLANVYRFASTGVVVGALHPDVPADAAILRETVETFRSHCSEAALAVKCSRGYGAHRRDLGTRNDRLNQVLASLEPPDVKIALNSDWWGDDDDWELVPFPNRCGVLRWTDMSDNVFLHSIYTRLDREHEDGNMTECKLSQPTPPFSFEQLCVAPAAVPCLNVMFSPCHYYLAEYDGAPFTGEAIVFIFDQLEWLNRVDFVTFRLAVFIDSVVLLYIMISLCLVTIAY